jgi:hypothetical protein
MFLIAFAVAMLLTPVPSAPAADDAALSYGNWEFTGKDNEGVTWKGPLTIEKLDTERFNPTKYNFMCKLDVQSGESSRGVEGPCKYDSPSRTLTIGGGSLDSYTYSAVLSADGKALIQGKWTEAIDREKGGNWVKVKISGNWSAKLAAK